MPNKPITKPILVAVEGKDYLYSLLSSPIVLDAQFQQSVLLWDFKEGGLNLGQFLGAVRLQRNFNQVLKFGLIFDAEFSAAGEITSARAHLTNNGFVSPAAPKALVAGAPAVSFLVMPDAAASGCLEHAFLAACAKPHLRPCADAFLTCVGGAALNANWQAKLLVHSIISGSGGNPAMTLGESVAAGLWDFTNPALGVMIDFIRSLY